MEQPFYDSEFLLMAAEKYGQLFEPFEMFGAVSETIRRLAMDGPGTDPAYPSYGSLRHVSPVTFCKGLFNQVHPKFTFQSKKIRPGTCF